MAQIIIKNPCSHPMRPGARISLFAERTTLAKRRWQACAADGAEFGFDLERHLHDGDVIFESETTHYVLAQRPEPVLRLSFHDDAEAARLAWSLGNLHFPIEISAGNIHTIDDPAVRQFLERDQIPFQSISAVFHPMKAITSHAHAH